MQRKPEKIDILNWIAENLKIIDKEGQLTNLSANIGQLKLHNTMNLQRHNGYPVRIALLKPRQVGWSTWSEAEGFTEVYHKPNWNAMAVSMDDESTNEVFRITQLFHTEMPVQRSTDHTTRREIIFSAPHRSRFVAVTAGKRGVGRSYRIQYLHASEVAWWRNAGEQLAGLYQMTPYKPGTTIILETTGFGMSGAFYETFWQAVARRKENRKKGKLDDYSGFLPVFFPWFAFPEYQAAIPLHYELKPDDYEKELISKYGLCNEQLYWRRLKIEELRGDVTLFMQEFPATSREAFQVAGRNVFNAALLEKWQKGCTPGATVLFETIGRSEDIRPYNVDRQENCWRIWEKPVPGNEYTIGIDTQEGKQSDPDDPKSDYDWHAAEVLNRHGGALVAEYHGQGDQHFVGEQSLCAAKYYNNAWVAPELPYGQVVLDVLKQAGYNRIYDRQKHDEQRDVEDSFDLGWKTTNATRPKMIEDFKAGVNDGHISTKSEGLVGEMGTFVVDKNGKCVHLPGEKDDRVFAAMIAHQLHLRCPLRPLPYPFSSTADAEKVKPKPTLARAGAIDDWEPGAEEDDNEFYTE